MRWKPKKSLEADYVKEINGKIVYVDVFGPNDDWRTILGKALCYSANADRAGGEYEVWLVTDFDDDAKTARLTGEKHKAQVEGWKMFYSEMKALIVETMRPGITGRVMILHAATSGERKVLEPIG